MNPAREKIVKAAESQLGKPYIFGIEIKMEDANPASFDCSEFVEWCFYQAGLHMPDGSQNQYDFTAPTQDPKPGDLGFFGDDSKKINHVGIIYSDTKVIEARGYPYNKVIFRPLIAWAQYGRFRGWRSHPQLLEA